MQGPGASPPGGSGKTLDSSASVLRGALRGSNALRLQSLGWAMSQSLHPSSPLDPPSALAGVPEGAPPRDTAPGARAGAPPDPAPALIFWALPVFFVLEFVRPEALVGYKFQFLVILLVPVAWALSRKHPWSAVFTAQSLFVILCGQGIFTAANNYQAYLTTRAMFGNVAIALGIAWAFSDRARFRKGIWIWVAITAYAAIYTVMYGKGPGGYVRDENEVALACAVALPFTLGGLDQLRGLRRWSCLGLSILFVSAVVASFSRGGFVSLVAIAACFLVASRRRLRNLMFIAIGALAFVALVPEDYLDEVRSIQETDSGTAIARRFLWVTATEMWKDNPVLGAGAGNFVWLAGRYQPAEGDWPQRLLLRGMSGTAVHSSYFQILSEQGTAGALLFVYIAFAHLRILRRLRGALSAASRVPEDLRKDAELYSAALIGSMAAFLAAGAFLSTAYYPYFWYLAGMSVALDAAVRRELPSAPRRPDPRRAAATDAGRDAWRG